MTRPADATHPTGAAHPATGRRTCGARIPVTEALRLRAFNAAPHMAGSSRQTVACALAEHGADDEHAGCVRPLSLRTWPLPEKPEPAEYPVAVWAHWTGDTDRHGVRPEARCETAYACPRSDGAHGCALPRGHRDLCSFALDDAIAEDETRVERVQAALALLLSAAAGHNPPGSLAEAAHDAVLLTWDELRARGIWSSLPAWDQAAVHRVVSRAGSVRDTAPGRAEAAAALAAAVDDIAALWEPRPLAELPDGPAAADLHAAFRRLPAAWQGQVLGSQRAPHDGAPTPRTPLADAIRSADAHAAAGEQPPEPTRWWEPGWNTPDDYRRGAELLRRLTALPLGWRVDAVRRVHTGTTALTAVSDAGMAINMLRGYGVYLGWCAPRQPNVLSASRHRELT